MAVLTRHSGCYDRLVAALRLLGLWWTVMAPACPAWAAASGEYQVKAVFLFNLAQFVGWPPTAFAAPDSPLVIGILGEDPFGSHLDEAVRNENVGGHPLVVRRYRSPNEVDVCHVLFVAASESERWEQIFGLMQNRSVLTVGDVPGFARRGGMVRFVTERRKIRLRINVEAAQAVQLTVSSMLLRSAELVTTGKD